MKQRTKNIGYGIIVLWMFLPMIPVLVAGGIAAACGCKVDEGSVHPCIVFGKDLGHLLYVMAMMGWFALGTFPTGILALIVFSLIVWWRNRVADQDDNL
jgi:hypothetical protein